MAEERPDEQINGSIATNLKKSFALQNFDMPEDHDQFQSDKVCAVCQIQFGKIGIVHAKKYICRFCLRGVCAKCSPQKIEHPNSKKPEKICSSCIEKMIETHLSEEYNRKIFDASSEKNNLVQLYEYKVKETQMEISYNHFTEQSIKSENELYAVKIKDLKDAVNEMLVGQGGTRENHKKLCENFKKFQLDISKKDSVIDTLTRNLEVLKGTYLSNKEILPGLRNRLGELQDIEFKLKAQIKEKNSTARLLTLTDKEQKLSESLDEFKHKIHVLEEEKIFFEEEIAKVEKENLGLNERLQAEGVGTRHKSVDSLIIASNQNFSLDEEAKMKELRDKNKENQKIIQNLRIQLESHNIFIKKSILDTDPQAEVGSRPCARCITF